MSPLYGFSPAPLTPQQLANQHAEEAATVTRAALESIWNCWTAGNVEFDRETTSRMLVAEQRLQEAINLCRSLREVVGK